MRFFSLALGSGLFAVTLAAHAATINETLTVDGSSSPENSGFYGVTSDPFSQFDPTLGTLTSITVSFTGTATGGSVYPNLVLDDFASITLASNSQELLFNPSGVGAGTFDISFNQSESDDLNPFEGSGTQSLLLQFSIPTSVSASGMVTYTYTVAAPVSPVPEPSSLALIGTGLAGVAGVVRRRLK